MKIIFACLRRMPGTSEDSSLYLDAFFALKKAAGPSGAVIHYPLERFKEFSRDVVNEEIADLVRREHPEALVIWADSGIDPSMIRSITENTATVTIGIFWDDDAGYFECWRNLCGGAFDWSLVAFPPAVAWHHGTGENVLGIPPFANPNVYKPLPGIRRDIDVSFVGNGGSPQRKEFIRRLEAHGITVSCFGSGWPSGPLPLGELVKIFNRSKINVNLAGQPLISWTYPKALARLFFKKKAGGTGIVPDFAHIADNVRTLNAMITGMVRGRFVEVLAARSFLLTYPAAYFPPLLEEGREIVHYHSVGDLAEKIKYYLAHEAERESIAAAGYQKCLKWFASDVVFGRVFDFIWSGDPKRKIDAPRILS